MIWLRCVVEKMPEHCIVSYIALFAKNMKTGYMEWSTFYVLGLLGRVIKKLAMSWIMPPLALLLHIVLSLIACGYVIRFNMYLEISVIGQCQTNIYLAWYFVRHSKKLYLSLLWSWPSSTAYTKESCWIYLFTTIQFVQSVYV